MRAVQKNTRQKGGKKKSYKGEELEEGSRVRERREKEQGKETPAERWEGHVLMPEGLNALQMDESIGCH